MSVLLRCDFGHTNVSGRLTTGLWQANKNTALITGSATPCSGGATPARLEIDKLPDGQYRATVGTLFEHQEICWTDDLEALLRHANAIASCRSFDDVVHAFRAMPTLG
jgi:hypothetical protein